MNTRVNQQGNPCFTEVVSLGDLSLPDLAECLELLLQELKLEIVRTNVTKHGCKELQIRKILL